MGETTGNKVKTTTRIEIAWTTKIRVIKKKMVNGTGYNSIKPSSQKERKKITKVVN